MITVTIPGPPFAQPRPRFNRRTGHAYDPAEAKAWKEAAAAQIRAALCARGIFAPAFAKGDPVHVRIDAIWPLPASAPKRSGTARTWRAVGPGDVDNVSKPVLDAAKGLLWHDDAQVAVLVVRKFTGARGEDPRVELVAGGQQPE